jgi:hypothetical protein
MLWLLAQHDMNLDSAWQVRSSVPSCRQTHVLVNQPDPAQLEGKLFLRLAVVGRSCCNTACCIRLELANEIHVQLSTTCCLSLFQALLHTKLQNAQARAACVHTFKGTLSV